MNESELRERTEEVRAAVAEAARRAGRDPSDVDILPVTKGFPASVVRLVVGAGFSAVGENRVGEAERKHEELGDLAADVSWQMIGHLQRNKAARAVGLFDRIGSVDSLRLARRLSADAESIGRAELPVLVQVNASGEASKGGFDVAAAVEAVGAIHAMPRLRVRGLMTMAPFEASEGELREVFGRTRRCLEACRERLSGFDGSELSMGMSGDFEIAVEEGATQVRLGTALLGERPD
ncbi:MAG TPA: YggS family pyridoxal phosphate-dependent enzyme [Gemmatimonadota bacterium]|nr:YggS family pyridoxal phosphate-dependent enzyme [Gemmatimonadota bacterium]